jgi:glyoxylase-like metal-dependent hydrolase (beta-lactamase superfamily II)
VASDLPVVESMMRIKLTVIVFVIFTTHAAIVHADDAPIEVTQLAPNLYRLQVDMVNVVALLGPDGFLLSDTAHSDTGEQLRGTLQALGEDRIKIIVCTHYHHDHVGGIKDLGRNATVIAHADVRGLLSSDQVAQGTKYKAFPEATRPNVTFSDAVTIHFGEESVEVTHLPNGHSSGDAVVYFKKANVLHMGDLLFSDNFPAVDYEHGGHVDKLADNLQWVIDTMPDDVMLVAGHGRNYSREDLKAYRSMITQTVTVVRKEMQKGMQLKSIKAAHPLEEWRKDWTKMRDTTDDWIETIYRSLKPLEEQ